MRLTTLRLTYVALLLTVTPAHAAGRIWLGANAGIGSPIGDFADFASTGFTIGLTGDLALGSQWSIGGEIERYSYGGNDDLEKRKSAELGYPTDLQVHAIPVIGHLKFLLPAAGKAQPFIKAGVGVFTLDSDFNAGPASSSHSETDLGFVIGGGLNLKAAESVVWGGELLYNYISGDGGTGSGGSLNQFLLRAHVLFGLGK